MGLISFYVWQHEDSTKTNVFLPDVFLLLQNTSSRFLYIIIGQESGYTTDKDLKISK